MTKILIGLTGGVASGKTTVCQLFNVHGIEIVDADEIAKSICEPAEAGFIALQSTLKDKFPYTSDKKLDRRVLRELIFQDSALKKSVEQALHPLILAELLTQAAAASSPYVILAVPLLIESGWTHHVDRILVIDLSVSEQITRLMQRDRIDEDLAKKMVAAQVSRQERLNHATDVIDNSCSTVDLSKQVALLHRFFSQLTQKNRLAQR